MVDPLQAFRDSPATQALVKKIEAETELTEAKKTASQVCEELQQAVKRIAEADPTLFNACGEAQTKAGENDR